jgi:hypothetical protein
MARVSVADVRAVLETSLTDAQVTTWIDIASNVIDRYATICTSASDATLAILEKLLTAHYIVATVDRSKTVTSRSFGDSSESYMSAGGEGLKASPYGQQLLMADPCGRLQDFTKPSAYSRLL